MNKLERIRIVALSHDRIPEEALQEIVRILQEPEPGTHDSKLSSLIALLTGFKDKHGDIRLDLYESDGTLIEVPEIHVDHYHLGIGLHAFFREAGTKS